MGSRWPSAKSNLKRYVPVATAPGTVAKSRPPSVPGAVATGTEAWRPLFVQSASRRVLFVGLLICLVAAPLLAVLVQDAGTLSFDTPDFAIKLNKDWQTIAALQPRNAGGFDFTPADRLDMRAADGFHSIGDLNLRVRQSGSGPW